MLPCWVENFSHLNCLKGYHGLLFKRLSQATVWSVRDTVSSPGASRPVLLPLPLLVRRLKACRALTGLCGQACLPCLRREQVKVSLELEGGLPVPPSGTSLPGLSQTVRNK